jgi:hypothetical protein
MCMHSGLVSQEQQAAIPNARIASETISYARDTILLTRDEALSIPPQDPRG